MILKEILNLMLNFLLMTPCFSLTIKDPIVSAYISGLINGKWSLIPTPKSRHLRLVFLVKKMKPNHPLLVFNGSAVILNHPPLGLSLNASME